MPQAKFSRLLELQGETLRVILVITFFCRMLQTWDILPYFAIAPIIGHSALKWALVTPAEEVMSIFYQDATQNRAQVSNEAPKGVRSQVMLRWHLFIHVICGEPIDGSIAPKDHENGNGNDDRNGQGLEVKPHHDHSHGQPKASQSLPQTWRFEVDRYPATDGVTQENEDVGDCKELAPLHQMLITLRIEQRHLGWMEHVEDCWPVLHRKMAQKLCCKEGHHAGHPLPCLAQGDPEVGRLEFRLASRGVLQEDGKAQRQAGHDVPIEGDNWDSKRAQGQSQNVDGCKTRGATDDCPGLGCFPKWRDDTKEGDFKNA